MPVAAISAVEAFSPAIEWTRRLLFRPFRLGVWLRFAVLGWLTGEVGGGGGSQLNLPLQYFREIGARHLRPPPHFPFSLWPLFLLLAVALGVLLLLLLYAGSVLRFALLEAVITGRVRLREGFVRWRQPGLRLFVWRLVFSLLLFFLLLAVVGAAVFLAWATGAFKEPRAHIAFLVLGGFLLFGVLFAIFVAGTSIWVLTKDFVVPIMALERVGPGAGWSRLLPMLRAKPGSYLGYLGFKILLALGSGMLLAVVSFILVLVLLVPAGIVALLGYLLLRGGGLVWNAATLTAVIVGGSILLAIFVMLLAFASVPIVVFFQCFVLQFFAGRFDRLAEWMYPPPSPPPAPA